MAILGSTVGSKNVLHDLDTVECHSVVRIGTPNENPKP